MVGRPVSSSLSHWQFTLPVILAYAALKIAGRWYHTRQARIAREKSTHEAKLARLIRDADREHELIQRGDVDGIDGSYPVPDDLRGAGIWLDDDTKQTARRSGPLRDVGFAG